MALFAFSDAIELNVLLVVYHANIPWSGQLYLSELSDAVFAHQSRHWKDDFTFNRKKNQNGHRIVAQCTKFGSLVEAVGHPFVDNLFAFFTCFPLKHANFAAGFLIWLFLGLNPILSVRCDPRAWNSTSNSTFFCLIALSVVHFHTVLSKSNNPHHMYSLS